MAENHQNVSGLLIDGGVKICAPMVRYSKLSFRTLVRDYNCDLAFTPMMMADSFMKSEKARSNDFTTNKYDRPLIAQFAAKNAEDFSGATQLIARYCDGVDLNCGCPQKWAMQECYGAHLLDYPDTVKDIVLQTWNRLTAGRDDFTISMKIRIHSDIKKTIEFCRRAEMAGISFITVHGRTKDQRKEPVNIEAIRLLATSVRCPLIANGDVTSLSDCKDMLSETGAKGVMVGRALLSNPALFAGYDITPIECIRRWMKISLNLGISFIPFHQHLMFMCEKLLPRSERRVFNVLNGITAVLDYFEDHYGITV